VGAASPGDETENPPIIETTQQHFKI